jgi:hypothetical protein
MGIIGELPDKYQLTASTVPPNLEILILKDFKKNLTSFIDGLIDQFPTDEDLIVLRIYFNDQVDIKKVMETFTHQLL